MRAGARCRRRGEDVSRRSSAPNSTAGSMRASIAMLAAGALDEVRALGGRGLDPALPAMKAHGVPWLLRASARRDRRWRKRPRRAKRDTRRYTKRQDTWFRHQLPDWTWVSPRHGAGRDPCVASCADAPASTASRRGAATARPAASTHQAGRTSMSTSKMGQQHAPGIDAAGEHVDRGLADRGHRRCGDGKKHELERGHLAVAPDRRRRYASSQSRKPAISTGW